jgi:hypothetical protein
MNSVGNFCVILPRITQKVQALFRQQWQSNKGRDRKESKTWDQGRQAGKGLNNT